MKVIKHNSLAELKKASIEAKKEIFVVDGYSVSFRIYENKKTIEFHVFYQYQ